MNTIICFVKNSFSELATCNKDPHLKENIPKATEEKKLVTDHSHPVDIILTFNG